MAQKKPLEACIFGILKSLDLTRTATSGNQAAHEAAARGKGREERGRSGRGAINTIEYNQQVKFASTCQHLPSASLSVTRANQAQLPLFQTSSHNLPMTLSVPLEAISLSTCALESPGLLLKPSTPTFRLQTFWFNGLEWRVDIWIFEATQVILMCNEVWEPLYYCPGNS